MKSYTDVNSEAGKDYTKIGEWRTNYQNFTVRVHFKQLRLPLYFLSTNNKIW